jgi:hypothetical protein
MATQADRPIPLPTDRPIWDRFFGVFPLVIVGSKEGDRYDLAPKHLAMPLGWENYFCFVCSPRHATYHNVRRHGFFTVSYPRPSGVLLASLAAAPRCEGASKPSLLALPTFPARRVDGVLVEGLFSVPGVRAPQRPRRLRAEQPDRRHRGGGGGARGRPACGGAGRGRAAL